MDEKDILHRQVDALEKLLQIKEAIIQEQDAKINRLENQKAGTYVPPQYPGVQPFVWPGITSVPTVWHSDPCLDGGLHDYPNPWHGTLPPPCNKCGKQATNNITITNTGGTFTKSE